MFHSTLPSIAEIIASTHVLSAPDATTTVIKVGKRFAVKYGRRVTPIEAANLDYLSANTTVPVPKLYAFMKQPETDRLFIVMEFIEGQTLEKLLPTLRTTEKQDVFDQIQEALSQLRNLPAPDYLGSVGRQAFGDGIFYTDPFDPAKSGPFASQNEMNEGILLRLAETCAPSHVRLLRTLIESTLQPHRTVFTHADLQPKNIMVRRKGTKQDGSGMFDILLIDWEMSGWYPEYWDFCNATVWDSFRPEWLEAVQNMMAVYPKEYLMVKTIRNILFLLG
ncbi:hypothetical protein LTR08_003553 [Meristemomyces frigidus]|nr:hypothetical protein LTR08_003553 [Meristemomyces frigidus]